ncbi:MAG: transglutaminase domain-containing protein, partial [Oscillospiraceae bacterium]|nr:transglutaminase domain-containing protein [Oscillospiraceae bacterium]
MNAIPYSNNISDYLQSSDIINFQNQSVNQLAQKLYQQASKETDFIKLAYEYVRDNIPHSADINAEGVPCTASDVLEAGHGICFAQSHLLAALLRAKSVPCGFCYQKLILDDDTAPVLVYHGLNGIYISEYKKWIRLDTRGDSEFSTESEKLAYTIRAEKGEQDCFIVYPAPDKNVIEKMTINKTR